MESLTMQIWTAASWASSCLTLRLLWYTLQDTAPTLVHWLCNHPLVPVDILSWYKHTYSPSIFSLLINQLCSLPWTQKLPDLQRPLLLGGVRMHMTSSLAWRVKRLSQIEFKIPFTWLVFEFLLRILVGIDVSPSHYISLFPNRSLDVHAAHLHARFSLLSRLHNINPAFFI